MATAAVLIPLVIGAIFGLSTTAFSWLLVVVFTACAWEYAEVNRLLSQPGLYALAVAVFLAAACGLLVVDFSRAWWPAVAVATAVVWALAVHRPAERRAATAVTAGFGTTYFLLAVTSLCALHRSDPWLVLLLVAMVALADSAAFVVGGTWGSRKLAPELSPNKTWEGAGASVVTAVAVAIGWALWRQQDALQWLLIAVAVNLAAQCGDLLQSTFKRQAGIKDSSNLLPGHGGVWDRTDAILLAAPAFSELLRIFER